MGPDEQPLANFLLVLAYSYLPETYVRNYEIDKYYEGDPTSLISWIRIKD